MIRSIDIGLIAATLFLAFVLSVLRLPLGSPEVLGWLRPGWVVLVLLYWVITRPQWVGIMTCWCVGLLMDVLLGAPLGINAIAFSAMAYGARNLYERFRMFSLPQQAAVALIVVLVTDLLGFWAVSVTRELPWSWWMVLPAIVSALVWPPLDVALRWVTLRFETA